MSTTTTRRELPWARIGTQFEEPPTTTEEALEKAELDWQVELRPLTYPDKAGRIVEVPNRRAAVRTDTGDILGIVGSRYTPVQNADAFSFVDRLTGHGDIMAAWHLKGSAQVGIAVRLGDVINPFGNGDGPAGGIQPYLVFQNAHDGSQAVQCNVINFQLTCTNQMASIARRALARWSAPHNTSVDEQMEMAGGALDLVNVHTSAYVEELHALAEVGVNNELFESIVKSTLSELRYKDRGLKNAYSGIRNAWRHSNTIDPHLQKTGYGMLHAVTEYWDHHRSYRTPRASFNTTMHGAGKACRDRIHRQLLGTAAGSSRDSAIYSPPAGL